MPWMKMHTDILHDPKLARAVRRGAKGLEMLPWLLVYAKASPVEGALVVAGEPAEAEEIAAAIPGSPVEAVRHCLASLVAIGVLVEDRRVGGGVLRFAAWERRASRPSDSAESVNERVKRHRERKRATQTEAPPSPATKNDDETRDVTRYTPLRNETEREREEERETETASTPLPPTASPNGNGAATPPSRADARSVGAGVAVVPISSRNGKHASATKPKPPSLRGVDAIKAHVAEALSAAVAAQGVAQQREFRRLAGAELVIAYHAHLWGLNPVLAPADKRVTLLVRCQRENGDDLNELLFAAQGSHRDPHFRGQNDTSTRYGERIATVFRDREQIERLARLVPEFRRGDRHPVLLKYVEGGGGSDIGDAAASPDESHDPHEVCA